MWFLEYHLRGETVRVKLINQSVPQAARQEARERWGKLRVEFERAHTPHLVYRERVHETVKKLPAVGGEKEQ
jgi:hypothetical protein